MTKYIIFVLGIISTTALVGCMTTTGNPDLNNRARELRLETDFTSDLQKADRQLQACIIYSFLLQEERGLEPREAIIRFACEAHEEKYRAAVMSGVRKEWQGREYVLNNTADTSTNYLYTKTINGLKK